jgi:hypothetical protein
MDIFKVGSWPMTRYRVNEKGVTFAQSVYTDEDTAATVVMIFHSTGQQVFVDREVTIRCGGVLSPRWIERFFESCPMCKDVEFGTGPLDHHGPQDVHPGVSCTEVAALDY